MEKIKYKRGNIFLIMLGYVFALIAGVNGVRGIHDILLNIMGRLYMGLIFRFMAVLGIMCIYWFFCWSFAYMYAKEYTIDEKGDLCEHRKYDKFTRVNGRLMVIVFLIVSLYYGSNLPWW